MKTIYYLIRNKRNFHFQQNAAQINPIYGANLFSMWDRGIAGFILSIFQIE